MYPCGLTQYGRRELILATVCFATACAATVWLAAAVSWWIAPAAVLPAAVYAWVLAFFRDPDFQVAEGPGLMVAPADGRVTDITNIGAESELGRQGIRVGIFMSIFNVHVNCSPVAGVVESIEHRAGAFLDARAPRASQRNESATIRLRYRHGGGQFPVVVRQIAGMIARRIVTDLREGQTVERGQRIGMIKFGSRLELLVPQELVGQVRVEVGRAVRLGDTVLVEANEGCAQ